MSYPCSVEDAKKTIKSLEMNQYATGGTSPVKSGGGGGTRSSDMSAGNNESTKKKGGKSSFANAK